MELEKLKKIYPSFIIGDQSAVLDSQYEWFQGPDGKQFGIKKDELTEREILLIKTMVESEYSFPKKSEREELWSRILLNNQQEEIDIQGFRFVFFYTDKEVKEPELFNEAIHALSPSPILWLTRQEGVIIEEMKTNRQSPAKFHEIVDLMMSDLYVKVSFFIGEMITDISEASKLFRWYRKIGQACYGEGSNKVSYLKDLFPNYLVSLLDDETKQYISNALLKDALDDQELIKTIQVYLQSNSNVTEASKKMFLHRNSLQYRIDKFIEWTGIDIKNFEGAVTTYLILKMIGKNN